MKIAITGASGDIGNSFLVHASATSSIKALVREGARISVPSRTNVEQFEFQDGLTYDINFLERFTESDTIVHCAALLNTTQEPRSKLIDYFAVNAFFTGLLTAACLKKRVTPKFVYLSSEMVYSLPNDETLKELTTKFVTFCEEKLFARRSTSYDLRSLATQFIESNNDFPYQEFDVYALTKYLGEAVVAYVPKATILRITNAYGPDYTNLRLIPRLIVGRLTGHGATYKEETRDFVYAEDINKLLSIIIQNNVTGIIDCKSGETTKTNYLRDTIVRLTPTAYGKLTHTKATTLGADSTFVGTDIDASGITIGNNVTWEGKALAFGGTVSTDADTISTTTCVASATTTDDGTGTTSTPGLPNTGLGSSSLQSSLLYWSIPAILVLGSVLYFVRKKA